MPPEPAAGNDAEATPVFELISAFGESSDARLRGNAIYALAALVRRNDNALTQRAREVLRFILAAPPADSASGQLAFAMRALDALTNLEEADRAGLQEALLDQLSGSSDKAQREWIARFQLAGMEPSIRCFRPGGWWRYVRLTWTAGRPLFWSSMWAGTWRTSWVWAPLLIAAVNEDVLGAAATLWLWSAFSTGLLATVSLAGRLVPPQQVQWVDMVMCGAVFGVLIAGAGVLLPEIFSHDLALWLVPLAMAVGVLVRLLRWLGVSIDTEPSGMAALLRPLASFALTTLACQLAVVFGAGLRSMATAWVVLAPASAVAAWLDIWLDRQGTGMQLTNRIMRKWLLPVLTGTVSVLVLLIASIHFLIDDPLNRKQLIMLPDALNPKSTVVVQTIFDALVQIDVREDGMYQITGGSSVNGTPPVIKRDGTDHVLVILDNQREQLKEEDSPEPPSLNILLKKGRYYACISHKNPRGCQRRRGWARVLVPVQMALAPVQPALNQTVRTLTITPEVPPPQAAKSEDLSR